MATLTPLWTGDAITADAEITSFLAHHGIVFATWTLPAEARELAAQSRLDDADKKRLLALFGDELGASVYSDADVVAIRPDLPGLDDALAKFDRLHYHDDDEVRAIVGGEGVFGFMTEDDRQFLLRIEAGEYISVPGRTWHWFYCTEGKNITALRLFEDMSGWTPHYRSDTT
jgi:1,2-dihydroxy-3-keto-5-methylthiopentene dioxygenase